MTIDSPELAALKTDILQELSTLTGSMASAEAMLQELAPMFLEDGEVLLAELETAVSQSQPPQIRQTAHALKGSSASLGFAHLSQLCLDLERMGRAAKLDQADNKLQEIKTEYTLIETLLQNYET